MTSVISRNGTPSSATALSSARALRLLQGKAEQPGGVHPVYGRPHVGTVADVGGEPGLPGDADEDGDELGVTLAVHRRGQPDDRGPHAAIGEGQRGRLGIPGVGRVLRAATSSVERTPAGGTGSPEAMTSGLPVPARASPKAAMVRPSTAAAAAGLAVAEKSWM